ncbi:MAG: SIMPL domain-containing protein [Candidatus Riflebacteria bacterium]|nr:SIMPL domain-containing protein [Candidatus Riflebacteria bacterium]
MTVSGTAVIQVVPDQLSWNVTVRTKGQKLPSIAKEHQGAVGKVLALLRASAVKEADTQTERMRFGEDTQYDGHKAVKVGYVASTSVGFTTKEFNSYEGLWNGLAAIDGVSVDAVAFESAGEADYRAEARQKAVVAAREKAKALASPLGASVGEPLVLEEAELSVDPWSNNLTRRDLAEDRAAMAIAPGRVAVRARVKATFRLHVPTK